MVYIVTRQLRLQLGTGMQGSGNMQGVTVTGSAAPMIQATGLISHALMVFISTLSSVVYMPTHLYTFFVLLWQQHLHPNDLGFCIETTVFCCYGNIMCIQMSLKGFILTWYWLYFLHPGFVSLFFINHCPLPPLPTQTSLLAASCSQALAACRLHHCKQWGARAWNKD